MERPSSDATPHPWVRPLVATVLLGVVAAGGVAFGRARTHASAGLTAAPPSPATADAPRTLSVPHVTAPPSIDGHLEEALWRDVAARTGPFVDAKRSPARPYSEGRFAWGDEAGGTLYVALYAADIDLQAHVTAADAPQGMDDAFRLTFPDDAGSNEGAASFVLEGSVLGTLRDARVTGGHEDASWASGARVAADTDGTPNDVSDDDEEWTLEWAIPLSSIAHRGVPGETIAVTLSRCDTPKHGGRTCASWGNAGEVALVLAR